MKMKHFTLTLAVLALGLLMVGTASAADFSTVSNLLDMAPAALAAAPIAARLPDAINRELHRKDAGSGEAGDAAEVVRKGLADVTEQVRQFCEKNKGAIEEAGDLSKKAKAQADELLQKQGELLTRLTALEQVAASGSKGGGGDDAETLDSVLRKAYEGEDSEIVDFMKSRNRSKSVNIPIGRKALVNSGTTGAALNYPGAQVMAQPLSPLLRRLTVRDLLMQGNTDQAAIWYPRETGFTNNAAPVSEGSLKPKSELTFETITENVRTVAHLMDVSLQMLADVGYIRSYIEGRMLYGLKLKEEAQLLTGAGTGQNLEGIYTAATAYSEPSGVVVVSETDLDKLRLALLQVELAEAFATGIVLHPTNWANIELLKDGENRYLFTNPQNTTTGRIWGRDVVSTQAMTFGRFLVGDFAMHAQVLDREDANIAISFENKDNFERNMATIRVEERLALAIYRPEAFVKGVLESDSGA
jgi:HK97 family phage major capsid protein